MTERADEPASIYVQIPGGADLIAWFGYVPSFHDAEIIELSLRRRAPSTLRVHAWHTGNVVNEDGVFVQEKHAVVTFAMDGVMDLQLEGFSHQNVISELCLRRAPERPERRPYRWADPSPDDLEIELGPCFGLAGLIRCKGVRISVVAGKPAD